MTDTRVPYVTSENWLPDLDGKLYVVWMCKPKEIPPTRVLRARFVERCGYEAEEVLTCENTRRGLVGIALGPVVKEETR